MNQTTDTTKEGTYRPLRILMFKKIHFKLLIQCNKKVLTSLVGSF